jgi:hypothetical protein
MMDPKVRNRTLLRMPTAKGKMQGHLTIYFPYPVDVLWVSGAGALPYLGDSFCENPQWLSLGIWLARPRPKMSDRWSGDVGSHVQDIITSDG